MNAARESIPEVLNRDAMTIPVDRLVEALEERIARKKAVLEERDGRYGGGRIWIGSYMENLGWPDLFGYDMNRVFADPALAIEMELRQRILWLDNSLDDGNAGLWIGATVGMYYDITLFGQEVRHTPGGVPEFQPHPLAERPDLGLIPPIAFRTSGQMPALLRMYEGMQRLNEERYGGRLTIGFPEFGRGPLDVAMQLRTYAPFVEDTMERPEFVHALLTRIVRERAAWNRERRRFLGLPEPDPPRTRVDDDWVNVPFLSPAAFREFVVPAYRLIGELEGTVEGFHTCGNLVPVVHDLLGVFPAIRSLDVSAWNDFEALDAMLDPGIGFWLAFKNTVVLSGSEAEHRALLEKIARLSKHRKVGVCAQAIVRVCDTWDENFERQNRFIALAREVFACG